MKHLKQKTVVLLIVSFWAALAFGDISENLETVPSSDEKVKKIKVKTVSDLKALAPFEDIAVIQKRFLPKTSRGEAGLSLVSILNNKFFYLMGVSGRLGYFIREKHGLGVQAYAIAYLTKFFSNRLQKAPNIITAYNPIAPRFFVGAYYKWTPVYGKFSFLDKKIHYFDMFFDFGLGAENIFSAAPQDKKLTLGLPVQSWVPASRLSAGQVFAINKNMGVVWNFTWYFYFFKLTDSPALKWQHDLSLSLGFNYYFPEVGSR